MPHSLATDSKNTIHTSARYEGDDIRIMICGLGGQGIALAADIVALVAAEAGCSPATQNVHGMAQRGESVYSLITIGQTELPLGAAESSQDYLVALETTEALRYHHVLKAGGLLISNDVAEAPITTFVGNDTMPPKPRKILKQLGAWVINAQDLAHLSGSEKAQNVLLLGALAQELPFDVELWKVVIERVVAAAYREENVAAFMRGYELKRR